MMTARLLSTINDAGSLLVVWPVWLVLFAPAVEANAVPSPRCRSLPRLDLESAQSMRLKALPLQALLTLWGAVSQDHTRATIKLDFLNCAEEIAGAHQERAFHLFIFSRDVEPSLSLYIATGSLPFFIFATTTLSSNLFLKVETSLSDAFWPHTKWKNSLFGLQRC